MVVTPPSATTHDRHKRSAEEAFLEEGRVHLYHLVEFCPHVHTGLGGVAVWVEFRPTHESPKISKRDHFSSWFYATIRKTRFL